MPKLAGKRKSQPLVSSGLKRKLDLTPPSSESEADTIPRSEEERSNADESVDEEDGSEDDMDGEKARAAAWEDDGEEAVLEQESDEDEDESDEADEATRLRRIQDKMSSLPLGTLLQAVQTASRGNDTDNESDGDDSSSSTSHIGGGSENPTAVMNAASGSEDDDDDDGPPLEFKLAADRKRVEKRTDKHAPTAITSKRPVSRYRQIVEPTKIDRRDPRFSALSGELSTDKFSKSYGFINELQVQEAKALRENIRTMRKELQQQQNQRDTSTTSVKTKDGEIPTLSLRQIERTEKEINRLQKNLKRTESLIQRSKQNAREREVLKKLKKEENEKRAAGKKEWYLKESEKKKILLQAKFEDLAKEGGQRMITKVLEKKQKKIAQQEKRARPYAKGEFYGNGVSGGAGEERYGGVGDGGRKGRSEPRREGRAWNGNGDRNESGQARKRAKIF